MTHRSTGAECLEQGILRRWSKQGTEDLDIGNGNGYNVTHQATPTSTADSMSVYTWMKNI